MSGLHGATGENREKSVCMNIKSVSKFLSLVLRHDPRRAGIVLDANGWTPVDDLLNGLKAAGKPISREQLELIVLTNDKKRFAFSEDRTMIRASQGHSVKVDLALTPVKPPNILFHGTATRNLVSILETGLSPRSRRHVHLSADEETALKVGMRHGKPVILLIDAATMDAAGINFYFSANGVWLTHQIDPVYLSVKGE